MAKSKRPGSQARRRLIPLGELIEERILLAPLLVTNTNDSGAGSLRQAILDANSTPGLDLIDFAISPPSSSYVIEVQTPLPAITDPVLLDGTSQPGYSGTPIIQINGGGMIGDGLLLAPGSDGSTVEGLDIVNFPDNTFTDGAGIHIQSSGNLVRSNDLGTDLSGKTAGPGNFFGVFIDGASGNTIGGAASGAGNLISGNNFDGVLILDEAQPARNNLVVGNLIGTDRTGTAALPNAGSGIDLFASQNTIGAAASGAGNLISANQGAGIALGVQISPPSGNVIEGNFIGTNLAGKLALGNAAGGISDNSGLNNTIGGTATGAGNLVSGNQGAGIILNSASGDEIVGNTIGTSPGKITDSTFNFLPIGNTGDGILLSGSTDNVIGLPGAGNLIAANQNNGVEIFGSSDINVISGNAIGTTLVTGSGIGIGPPVNLGNAADGISVEGSSANTIGGLTVLDSTGHVSSLGGNVVSGNGQSGILIVGNDISLPPTSHDLGNIVLGNLIGTRADGTLVVGNGEDGIQIGDSAANTIGGSNSLNPDGSIASLRGNVASGNQRRGIQLNGSLTTGNLIVGNRIGTDLAGATARPNSEEGILVYLGASNNTIGAPNSDGSAANLVSGNGQSGIEFQDAAARNHVVGNRVGISASGTATIPNLGDGVLINAAGNVLGGTVPGSGNVISGNLGAGVRITNSLPHLPPTSADNNLIVGNRIGVDPNGVSSGVGNVESGVEIDNASSTTIGGTTASPGTGAGNVISGNRQAGIHLTGSSTATLIQGNLVGLNSDGTAGQGNLLPGILLDGVAGNTVGGRQLGAGNVLSNNGAAGVAIQQSSNTTVQGNLIGTDPTGTVALSPIQNGVSIVDGTGNTIGGTDASSGNLISGNGLSGILVSGSAASANIALGNRIGTDRSGTRPLGNGLEGVFIDSARGNTIGGTAPGAKNLISANRANGVAIRGTISAPASNNIVTGNFIGTSDSGAAPLGNAQDGVFISAGASNNTIGGPMPGAGNLISANQADGVELFGGAASNQVLGNLIGTDASGGIALGNNVGVAIQSALGNTIGGLTPTAGQGPGNVISGNRLSGVLISGIAAEGNQVLGNLIGTDATGSKGLPNSSSGVSIDSAQNNLIGGDIPGAGNVIAANRTFGVLLLGRSAKGNRVAGNMIGTNTEGVPALGNALDGVIINAAADNTVGGLTSSARNVISGNGGNGINVLNISGADGIWILGNLIGTDPAGHSPLGNALDGVLLNSVAGTLIAGAAFPNVISGNTGSGIHLLGAGSRATVIEGSLIGTDLSGTARLANGGDGVSLEDAGANTIGGVAPGQGNLISGNAGAGIHVFGAGASGNVVLGDTIGTDAAGASALPNGGFGISIESSTSTLVQANLISGNFSGGVQISGFGAGDNRIYGCLIGTDRAGGSAISNGVASLNNGNGVFVNGAGGNFIGGDGPGQGNLISGNATAGVYLFGRFAAGNVVAGNLIGTNLTGLRPIFQDSGARAQQVGVLINQAPGLDVQDVNPGAGNTIGGLTPTARNVISGNLVGIEISGTESSGNVVSGNLVGPASDGTAGTGNIVGVYINGAPGNTIGGSRGNVISGNNSVGVYILGSPSTGNQVTGNLIGLAPDGLRPLPNQNGIFMENAPGNVIGGVSATSRNVISANRIVGVYILGGQSVGNVVEGNLIGYDAFGRGRHGNGQYGVLLYNAPANTVVRSGPSANRITASGIANFREFTGRRVTANPPSGQPARQPRTIRRRALHQSAQRRLLFGQPVPAGPIRRQARSR
jgi:hypothetical protein